MSRTAMCVEEHSIALRARTGRSPHVADSRDNKAQIAVPVRAQPQISCRQQSPKSACAATKFFVYVCKVARTAIVEAGIDGTCVGDERTRFSPPEKKRPLDSYCVERRGGGLLRAGNTEAFALYDSCRELTARTWYWGRLCVSFSIGGFSVKAQKQKPKPLEITTPNAASICCIYIRHLQTACFAFHRGLCAPGSYHPQPQQYEYLCSGKLVVVPVVAFAIDVLGFSRRRRA